MPQKSKHPNQHRNFVDMNGIDFCITRTSGDLKDKDFKMLRNSFDAVEDVLENTSSSFDTVRVAYIKLDTIHDVILIHKLFGRCVLYDCCLEIYDDYKE